MSLVENFEQIIHFQQTRQLVPFLLQLEKADIVPIRQSTKSLHKELTTFKEIKPGSWGSSITVEQRMMLFLAGLKTYSRKEALTRNFWEWNIDDKHLMAFWSVLEDARPVWLSDLFAQNTGLDLWRQPPYALLREMERRGLIDFNPRLFALSTAGLVMDCCNRISQSGVIPTDASVAIAAEFSQDPILLQRDLPLLFDFDTEVVNSAGRVQLQIPLPQLNNPLIRAQGFSWQVWNEMHPPQSVTWLQVLSALITTHHLDRADILTRCLLALRRDFRRPLLTWFKELFLSLKPTRAERLARQAELTELLAHPLPLVVNFAIEQVKNLLPEPGFALAPLLQSADNLLLRPDLKTGLKTLLAGLARLPRQDAAHAPAVARLLAAALAHPDAAVQERAAKGLADLLAAKKPLLPPADTAETLAALATQAELLGAAARAVLAPWLASPTPAPTAEATATYAPRARFVPDISPATALAPVADWHELLFLTGQVLRHDDPAALERWLDGLLRLHGQLPAGYAEQLEPYLVQVLPELKKATTAEAAALLAGPISIWGHDGLAQALLLSWATDFATPRVPTVEVTATHYARTPLLPLDKHRYAQAENLLRQRQPLPLLSTPTHAPHWVAPTTVVNRLLAYQSVAAEPAVADLLLALTRTAHAHPGEAAAALQLLPQLQRAALRELLTWFFGPALTLPTQAALPARQPADLTTTLAAALPELWAVAARTKAPAHVFPDLPARLGYDYAGIMQPLRPVPAIQTGENHFPQPQVSGQTTATYRWTEVHWHSGADGPLPSPLLVYSPPAAKSKEGSWEHNMLLKSDFQFLVSLLPNYPAPLYEDILRRAAWADNLESSERDLVAQALHALLGPGPAYELAASALLASGLIHHAPLCRGLSQEVLVQAVANGRLLPDFLGQVLGRLLAADYAPVARLADNLAPLRAISPETDDALAQTLDALLPALPPRPAPQPAQAARNLRRPRGPHRPAGAASRAGPPARVEPNGHAQEAGGQFTSGVDKKINAYPCSSPSFRACRGISLASLHDASNGAGELPRQARNDGLFAPGAHG